MMNVRGKFTLLFATTIYTLVPAQGGCIFSASPFSPPLFFTFKNYFNSDFILKMMLLIIFGKSSACKLKVNED